MLIVKISTEDCWSEGEKVCGSDGDREGGRERVTDNWEKGRERGRERRGERMDSGRVRM